MSLVSKGRELTSDRSVASGRYGIFSRGWDRPVGIKEFKSETMTFMSDEEQLEQHEFNAMPCEAETVVTVL